jgi:hypothetical protein
MRVVLLLHVTSDPDEASLPAVSIERLREALHDLGSSVEPTFVHPAADVFPKANDDT